MRIFDKNIDTARVAVFQMEDNYITWLCPSKGVVARRMLMVKKNVFYSFYFGVKNCTIIENNNCIVSVRGTNEHKGNFNTAVSNPD